MPSPRSPSMPTTRQIKEVCKVTQQLYPNARIKRIGPDGVDFDYPDKVEVQDIWSGKPFSGDLT